VGNHGEPQWPPISGWPRKCGGPEFRGWKSGGQGRTARRHEIRQLRGTEAPVELRDLRPIALGRWLSQGSWRIAASCRGRMRYLQKRLGS